MYIEAGRQRYYNIVSRSAGTIYFDNGYFNNGATLLNNLVIPYHIYGL